MLPLSHLEPAEFEELTYDLLKSAGALDLSWRKGTPLQGSSPDGGRDIECVFRFPGPTGDDLMERWFVQCKHYDRGVPAESLDGALAWASANRPNCLHLVVSGFLSNSAKDLVAAYEAQNKPPFRIKVWENPDIASRIASLPELRHKYRIGGPDPELALFHEAHVRFMTRTPLLSLDKFFELLEALEPGDRDSYLGIVRLAVIPPTVRPPLTAKESLLELIEEDVSYTAVKRTALQLSIDPILTSAGIMSFILGHLFACGNHLRIPSTQSDLASFNAFLEKRAADGEISQHFASETIAKNRALIAETPARIKRNYESYRRFCDAVLVPLLAFKEPMVFPDWAGEAVDRLTKPDGDRDSAV